MSLLMKALEKAAQDRDKTPAAPPHTVAATTTATAKATGRELTLETVELKPGIKADENTSRVSMSPKRAASAPANPAPPGISTPLSSKDPVRSGAQARAASVLNVNAQQPRSAGAIAWLLARPVYAIGGLAVLLLLLYGGYVYVQIAHPGLLLKTPPRAPAVAIAPAPIPVAVPAASDPLAAGTPQSADATNAPFVSMQSVLGGRVDSPPSSLSSLSPLSPSSSNASTAPNASRETSGSVPPQPARPAPVATQPPQSGATPAVPTTAQSRVSVSRGDTAVARVNPTVSEAYAALEAGQFDAAQRLYGQVLRSEPANVDALLGMAAIAQQDNRNVDAQRHFLAILDVEPRNALAQSGLIALMSRADPQAAESRLKQLLAREPSPPLYFNLGNLYAEQGQWPQAQQAYFQAHSLEPRNPDYAYNLAVGLEHLGQQKLALDFYRKALQLASAKGSANFDSARTQERITQLAARLN